MPDITLTECTRLALGLPRTPQHPATPQGGCVINVRNRDLAVIDSVRKPGWSRDDAFFFLTMKAKEHVAKAQAQGTKGAGA